MNRRTSHRAPRTLAVIIGRSASKGLPGKNALPLAGRPMVCHTIDDALEASLIDETIVSTDGRAIAEAARDMAVHVIDRPAELATDGATVDAAVRHAVLAHESTARTIVILYANVPVRPDDLIDRAIQMLLETEADSVQSYSPVGKMHPWWMVRLDETNRVAAFVENACYRRQDLPPLYIPDGGVIAVTRESLFAPVAQALGGSPVIECSASMAEHSIRAASDRSRVPAPQAALFHPHAFLGRDRRGIVSDGAVVDVDTPHDFAIAQAMLAPRSGCVRT